jgi:hypothetical protein
MSNEINYDELIIGKEYICKCYSMYNKLKITKIEYNFMNSGIIFVRTNKPAHIYQVFPNKTVSFFKELTVSYNIKTIILEPYTMCPITWEYFEDGDEIITIDDRFMFRKKELEDWLKQKYVNPLTNIEIKESDLKYYTVIILPLII